jgi:glycine/D-amino acid oxidase-like deaminating enzyme
MSAAELPADAAHVIIGAGAVGCSVAAALVERGHTDLVVLDTNADLAQGTTSMGAGMFGLLRNDPERVARDVEGLELLWDLERDATVAATGLEDPAVVTPGFEQTGSIRLASTPDGIEGLHQLLAIARTHAVEAELIGPEEIASEWPLLDSSRCTLGLWVSRDGQMRPHRVAAAFMRRATRRGARLIPDTRVTAIRTDAHGSVSAVDTDRGSIATRSVINAAGTRAAHVAAMVGLNLPIIPVRHCYFVTVPLAGVPAPLPTLRFSEEGLYVRARDGAIMLGGWERPGEGASAHPTQTGPEALSAFPGLPFGTYERFAERVAGHLPEIQRWPRQSFAAGWPTFTPDAQHVIGPTERVPGFSFAAGCNAHGIAGAPAIGRLLADSLTAPRGAQDPYLRRLSPDRFPARPDWALAMAQAIAHSESYNTITPASRA